jgi:hypothetical protein
MGGRYPGGEQVQIVLRALPDTVPVAVRLRSLLKYALRSCRFRCLAIQDVAGDAQAGAGRDRPTCGKCAKAPRP